MTQEQRLIILEAKLSLLKDYHKRCKKTKRLTVAYMIARIETKINRYYASLSKITG